MASYFKMATIKEKALCVPSYFVTKFMIEMQRNSRTQYGEDVPSGNAIWRQLLEVFCTAAVAEGTAQRMEMPNPGREFLRRQRKSLMRVSLQGVAAISILEVIAH
jgi:hypothetical protein